MSGTGELWGGGSNRGGCLFQDSSVDQVLGTRRLEFPQLAEVYISAMDAGREHYVAVSKDGSSLVTWGCSNEFGQVGQGSDEVSLSPVLPRMFSLQPRVRVCAVSCGQDHTLALTERGEVFSWGDGSMGQLGCQQPKGSQSASPLMESSARRVEAGALRGLPVRQIAAGAQHSMALGLSGQVIAWGCNKHGRLGLGVAFSESGVVSLPTHVAELPSSVRSLGAGGRHSAVVLRKGLLLMAGDNRHGQLGRPPSDLESASVFQDVHFAEDNIRVRTVALGEAHTLLLSYEGALYGMGAGDRGQLGEPFSECVHVPRCVSMPDSQLIIWAVVAGTGHSLVLAQDPPASHTRSTMPTPRALTAKFTASGLLRQTQSVPGYPRSSLAEASDQEEDDDPPLLRANAYQGSGESLGVSAQEIKDDDEEGALTRLRSSGCTSKLASSRKLSVPLSTMDFQNTLSGTGHAEVKLVRPIVRPGVAGGIVFVCLTLEEFVHMVSELPQTSGSDAEEQLCKTVAAILRSPTVLGASFLFPSLSEARLDASGLCRELLRTRGRLACLVEQCWAAAALQGLRSLAPPGGVLRNLRTRDQVRPLVMYLMLPDWPKLLANYPMSTDSADLASYESAQELLRVVARLPIAGRAAFRDVVSEECGDIMVLRDILLTAARALAAATLRRSKAESHLRSEVWEAVLLLQLLWAAEAQRVKGATEAVRAARTAEQTLDLTLTSGRLGRSLSKTTTHVDGSPPAAGVALPRSCFHIDALVDTFPPSLELQLFAQHAHMQVIDPPDLCSDPKWELDSRGGLPAQLRSFMAHGNLVSTGFKQLVLQAENTVRQAQEQQRQIFSQALGSVVRIDPNGGLIVSASVAYFVLQVNRSRILADTMTALHSAAPQDLKRPLKVQFVGEQGVDEGGVAKEYFQLLSAQLFNPEYGMFKVDSESRYLWFDPFSYNEPNDFWTVGAVLGLAIYNNLPGLDVNFPIALFKKLKDQPLTFEDLRQAFPSHTASLQAILDWEPPSDASAEEADLLFQNTFCLDFSVSIEAFGEVKTVGLLDGEDAPPPVSLPRRQEFAEKFKDWYLTDGVKVQFDAFRRGFSRVCGSPVFDCLSAAELEAILCGEKDLDFSHLREGSRIEPTEVPFQEGYVQQFWEVVCNLDLSQKRQFLRFVTGSELAPVGGLSRLKMKVMRNDGEPTDRLPTSQTCFNLLMLPEYADKNKLRRLLLAAIENAEGFGLE